MYIKVCYVLFFLSYIKLFIHRYLLKYCGIFFQEKSNRFLCAKEANEGVMGGRAHVGD